MAEEKTRRALRQTGMPPYDFPLGRAIARVTADGSGSAGIRAATAVPTIVLPAVEPGTLERAGNVAREAFPRTNAARTSVVEGAIDAANKGEYARAAGNVARGMVTLPVAAAVDTTAPLARAVSGIGSFLGGVLGSKGDATVTKTQAQPAAAPAAPAPRQSVVKALTAAAPEVTPQDALGNFLRQVLTSPNATMGDLSRAGALVPAVTKNGPKAKDTVLAQTAALSEAIFSHANSEIDAAVKAGTITPEQGKIGKEKATAEWFQRNGGLVGFDPTKMVQAQLLGQDEEE